MREIRGLLDKSNGGQTAGLWTARIKIARLVMPTVRPCSYKVWRGEGWSGGFGRVVGECTVRESVGGESPAQATCKDTSAHNTLKFQAYLATYCRYTKYAVEARNNFEVRAHSLGTPP